MAQENLLSGHWIKYLLLINFRINLTYTVFKKYNYDEIGME
jgi:hypothetical protein